MKMLFQFQLNIYNSISEMECATLNTKYNSLNKNIELMTMLVEMLCVLTPIALSLPTLLLSCINYFIYDLGNDSFLLQCPAK